MRIVKWNPQERADAPDLTAMSYLVLGEFRRMVRGALIGDSAFVTSKNFIIQGFKVEAQPTPDSTVVVKLVDGASPLSLAWGAELIGSRVDYGQLIGGDNSDAATEGSAQQTIDFGGQPAATYTVQMRYVYEDAALDNRAFWNPSGNTEFIAAVNTRTLPQFQLRISGAASAEWIDLADVAWAGSGTVSSFDITDKREFAFEGIAPFRATTKSGPGAVPNFYRGIDRSITSLAVNSVYPILRALSRQLQDIKGQDDAGYFNWYRTAYKSANPSGTLGDDQSTSLRSLRTTHFTVGDGVTTFGDFYGTALASGLDACLAHIETEQANFGTDQITVKILDENAATYNISNRVFTLTSVKIIGVGGDQNGRVTVQHGGVVAGTYVLDSALGLALHNIDLGSGATDANRAGLRVTGGDLELLNCAVNPGLASGTESGAGIYAVSYASTGRIRVRDSEIRGRVVFDHPLISSAARVYGALESTNFYDTCIEIPPGSNALTFDNCEINGLPGGYTAVPGCGGIQGTDNVTNLRFTGCTFHNPTARTDAVRFQGTSGLGPRDITITRCTFELSSGSTREPNVGTNGALGTGWGVFLEDASTILPAANIAISHCAFDGDEMFDSGAIYASKIIGLKIDNNSFVNFGASATPTGVTRCPVVWLNGSLSAESRNFITNNFIGTWGTSHSNSDTFYGLRLGSMNGLVIQGNHFDGKNGAVSPTVISGTSASCALEVNNCSNFIVAGNTFSNFQFNTSSRKGIKFVTSSSNNGVVQGNTFDKVGQAPVDLSTGGAHASIAFAGNTFINVSAASTAGIVLGATVANCAITGNVFAFTLQVTGIDLNGADNNTVLSNVGNNCVVVQGAGTNNVGYLETPDMNNVALYA